MFGLVTDATGRYRFDSLPPGRYLLQFEIKPSLVIAKDNAPQYVWLTVGSTDESVVVGAPKPAVAGVAPTPGPQRLRVGGMVQPSRLISRTDLVYPPELQQLGIDGTVMLRAIISKTGDATVEDSPAPPQPVLLQALLQDRFGLVAHREMRPLPTFELALAREGRLGPRLTRSSFDCAAYARSAHPPPEPGRPPTCGTNIRMGALSGRSISMAQLALASRRF